MLCTLRQAPCAGVAEVVSFEFCTYLADSTTSIPSLTAKAVIDNPSQKIAMDEAWIVDGTEHENDLQVVET